jgi:hypothetical protein
MREAWPWDVQYDKRMQYDRRRALIVAASMIVAEIERLDRATAAVP